MGRTAASSPSERGPEFGSSSLHIRHSCRAREGFEEGPWAFGPSVGFRFPHSAFGIRLCWAWAQKRGEQFSPSRWGGEDLPPRSPWSLAARHVLNSRHVT